MGAAAFTALTAAATATLAVGLVAVGGAAVEAQRVSGVADAAALAAADALSGFATGDPCSRAAEVAEAQAASTSSCEVDGLEVVVTAAGAHGAWPVSVTSRAGPGSPAAGAWSPAVDLGAPGLLLADFFGARDASITGYAYAHEGIDLSAPHALTPIAAAAAGTVTAAVTVDASARGMNVAIDHGDGVATEYLHLARVDVRVGDAVEAGQTIGGMGSTGRSTGTHLHLGVVVDGVHVDPLTFMRSRGVDYCVLPVYAGHTVANGCEAG
ncbi:M23 family metallopeptidase [Microbacterium indicum]|uniref:M23 family metallopeptidase n=1 Tax=Microbacterium indicum TaxID=358100 RepID=UPI000406C1FD|nr:M23 family metallopeptidase [Microbacterium indicum]